MTDLADADFDPVEQELAELLTGYADRANSGEALELEQACADHPKFEKDLRELWSTIAVTNIAADEQRGLSHPSTSELLTPRMELPCPFAKHKQMTRQRILLHQ